MDQDIAVTRMIDSICELELTDYQKRILTHYLTMMYAVGYDAGVKENHHFQRVEQFDNEGFSHKFETAMDAALYLNTTVNNIYKAIRRKGKCQGFYWRYI